MTPLHYAAYCENLAEVKHCVEEGWDVNQKSDCGWTPLVWCIDMAAMANIGVAEAIFDYLVSRGADTEYRDSKYENLIEFARSRDPLVAEHLERVLGKQGHQLPET
jgi:ankyrin repeat protein